MTGSDRGSPLPLQGLGDRALALVALSPVEGQAALGGQRLQETPVVVVGLGLAAPRDDGNAERRDTGWDGEEGEGLVSDRLERDAELGVASA